jgi:hypothetical protein
MLRIQETFDNTSIDVYIFQGKGETLAEIIHNKTKNHCYEPSLNEKECIQLKY